MFSALTTPFILLDLTARYLWREHPNFRALVAYSTMLKVCRFAAFLLPFKALMLQVTAERIITIRGYEISSKTLSIGILIIAVVFFLAQWAARNRYESHLLRHVQDDGEPDDLLRQARSNTDEQLFRSTVDFIASQLLAIILVLACISVMPWSALVILPVSALYFMNLARLLETKSEKRPDLSWHNTMFNFASMIAVLVILGILAGFNAVSPLPALFVFISSRQLMASYAEIGGVLVRYRNPILPGFLKDVGAAASGPLIRKTRISPPFFQSATRDNWFLNQLGELPEPPTAVESATWLYVGSKSIHSFLVKARTPADQTQTYLCNIFGMRDVDLARTEHACMLYTPNDLCLPFQARRTEENYITLVYKFDGDPAAAAPPVLRQTADILATLCSVPVDKLCPLAATYGDFLASIDEGTIDMLRAAAPIPRLPEIERFSQELASAKMIIAGLPAAQMNPSINQATLLQDKSGQVKLLTWCLASIQPIGCQLHFLPAMTDAAIEDILVTVRAVRNDCAAVEVPHLRLAAALLGLTRNVAKSALLTAIDDIKDALAAMDKLK